MTIKKIFLILLTLGLTMSLFGYGQREGGGPRFEEFKNLIESKEKVSLTGQVIISNRVFPEFKAGENTYKLIIPRYYLFDLDIADNKEVTVEGVILKVKQGVRGGFLNEGDEVFFVTKALIDGKEYTPEQGAGQCQGPRQGRWGMMGPGFNGHNRPGFHGSLPDIFE